MNLPQGVRMEQYADDFLLIGENITATSFQEIVSTMTPDEKARCIGWRSIGKNRVNAR